MDTEELLFISPLSETSTVSVWDFSSKNPLMSYKNGGAVTPNCLAIIADSYILTAEKTKCFLHLWSFNNPEPEKNLRMILPEPANCLDVCPRGSYLAVGISSKLYVWELSSGKLLSVQSKHYQSVSVVKFSSCGLYVLAGGEDGMLVVYALTDLISQHLNYSEQSTLGQVEPVLVKNDHSMPITDIFVGPFGGRSRFASLSADKTCKFYYLNDPKGQMVLEIVANVNLTKLVFDSRSQFVYLGTTNGTVIPYNLHTNTSSKTVHLTEKKTIVQHKDKVTALALNQSETVLASGSNDGSVIVINIKAEQQLKRIDFNSAITNLTFVMACKNFPTDVVDKKIIVKSLERTVERDMANYIVSINQQEDLESDEDISGEKVSAENRELRFINKQMYSILN